MFDYKLLNALWAVLLEGSFDLAAQRLNITSSAISQRIKLLESRAGQILIVRGKPCVATEFGYTLFSHMEQVKLLEQDTLSGFERSGLPLSSAPPVMRIGVSGDSMNTWFNQVTAEFCSTERVLFHIVRDDRELTIDALKKGEVIASVTPSKYAIEGLKVLPLGRLEYSAVASPEFYRKHLEGELSLEVLSTVPGIAFNEKDGLPQLWVERKFGQRASIECHRIPSYSGYLEACCAGIGWGVVPSPAVKPLIEQGQLIELCPQNRISTELVWQYNSVSSEILRRLTKKVGEVSKRVLAK